MLVAIASVVGDYTLSNKDTHRTDPLQRNKINHEPCHQKLKQKR